MLRPAGMPAQIVALLNAAIAKIVKMPDIAERIAAQGTAPRMGTPDQTLAFIKAELAKWEKVVAAAGIRR